MKRVSFYLWQLFVFSEKGKRLVASDGMEMTSEKTAQVKKKSAYTKKVYRFGSCAIGTLFCILFYGSTGYKQAVLAAKTLKRENTAWAEAVFSFKRKGKNVGGNNETHK